MTKRQWKSHVGKQCVMCGKPAAMLWTLDNMKQAVVTYLCKDDAAPLQAIMEAAGELPPSEQVPLPDRDMVIHARGRRQPKMAPLDWIPPTPPKLQSVPAELTDLDLIVIQFREEGMSWAKIGETLDISGEAAREQFGHLPVRNPGDEG